MKSLKGQRILVQPTKTTSGSNLLTGYRLGRRGPRYEWCRDPHWPLEEHDQASSCRKIHSRHTGYSSVPLWLAATYALLRRLSWLLGCKDNQKGLPESLILSGLLLLGEPSFHVGIGLRRHSAILFRTASACLATLVDVGVEAWFGGFHFFVDLPL